MWRVLDAELGSYYLRARYYDPAIGRFITEDSYSGSNNDPLSLNLYTYTKNNPIMYFDPSGFIAEKYLEELIGLKNQYSSADITTQQTLHKRANELRQMIKNSYDYIENWYGFADKVNETSLFDINGSITLSQTKGLYDFLTTSINNAKMNETIGNAVLAVGSGLAITYGGEAIAGSRVVQAIGSGIAAGWDKVKNFFTGAGPSAAIDKGVGFSQAAAQHMQEAGRTVPVQSLIDTIKNGACMADPQGSRAMMYYSQMVINGERYNLEVLYDKVTNTIWHFQYY